MAFGNLAVLAMLNAIASHRCAHCSKYGATWKAEVWAPDDSWECWRYWCGASCHANWSTNQSTNKQPK